MKSSQSDETPKTEDIENALIDFGFYHNLNDVFRMYDEYKKHGNYGYAGGVMDQPDEYWMDMDTMIWLELYQKYVAPLPRLPQESVFDQLRNGGGFGVNWLTNGGK